VTDFLTFRLSPDRGEGERVLQLDAEGETVFNPLDWGAFLRGSLVVHACRIPRPFRVNSDICKDGYLVFDGRLKAIDAKTFAHDYEPLALRAAA
jgi:hypothetical protein